MNSRFAMMDWICDNKDDVVRKGNTKVVIMESRIDTMTTLRMTNR